MTQKYTTEVAQAFKRYASEVKDLYESHRLDDKKPYRRSRSEREFKLTEEQQLTLDGISRRDGEPVFTDTGPGALIECLPGKFGTSGSGRPIALPLTKQVSRIPARLLRKWVY